MTTRQNVFSTPMNRRRAFGLLAGAAVAGSTVGVLSRQNSAYAEGGKLEAIYDLNMFAEPHEDSTVVGWVGTGQIVFDHEPGNPEVVDGFRYITTEDGTSGWVLDEGLQWYEETDPGSGDPVIRYLSREDTLLLEPYGEPIMSLDFGTQVRATEEVSGEYRLVRVFNVEEEVDGWILNWILTPDTTQRFAVNAPIPGPNAPLLAEPDLEVDWVGEVPDGEYVLDYDHEVVNGFYGVQWRDVSGWILGDYLAKE